MRNPAGVAGFRAADIVAGGGPMREAAVEGRSKLIRFIKDGMMVRYWDGEG